MASEAPSTERDGNRWALLYITAPTLDPTAAHEIADPSLVVVVEPPPAPADPPPPPEPVVPVRPPPLWGVASVVATLTTLFADVLAGIEGLVLKVLQVVLCLAGIGLAAVLVVLFFYMLANVDLSIPVRIVH